MTSGVVVLKDVGVPREVCELCRTRWTRDGLCRHCAAALAAGSSESDKRN